MRKAHKCVGLTLGEAERFSGLFYRRQGLSLKLMQAAEDWLSSQGIDRIEVQITRENEASLAMCRKLGYQEKRLVLEKKI